MIPSEVTIPADEDMACFISQSIIDDDISQEPDDDFDLNIPQATTPDDPRIVISDGTTTVTILDDDGKFLDADYT